MIRLELYFFTAAALATCAMAQPRYFAGAGPGMSILSSGTQSMVTANRSALSHYRPELGLMAHGFAGVHPWEYLSFQGAWSWNRNVLTFSAVDSGGGAYEQSRNSSQHNLGVDALLYFRSRTSFIRPFLSVGLNYMRLRSDAKRQLARSANSPEPPSDFAASAPGLRVAAGADLVAHNGWGFRYAFLENQQRNVIAHRLQPPGSGILMNFQHVFAIVKHF